MRKAVLYARVSSELQRKEKTIDSQIIELKKQIRNAGDILVKEYIDDGHSGAYLDRPGLDALREGLKTDTFEAVYFHAADRIARDVVHQNIVISDLIKYKKRIIINGIDYEENPENKFALTVFGAVAQFERAKLIERTKRGWLHRVRMGQLASQGQNIYGYDYISKTPTSPPKLIVNKKEAAIVRYLFENYANGTLGTCQLSRALEKKGILTSRGKPRWDAEIIRRMLRNTTYIGTRYYNRHTREQNTDGTNKKNYKIIHRDPEEWIAVKVPSIISKEMFNKANKRLKESCKRYRRPNTIFLLKGLIRCGVCNRTYSSMRWYERRLRKNGKVYVKEMSAYKCTYWAGFAQHDPKRLKRCRNSNITTRFLENKVLDLIKEIMLKPEKLTLCMDRGEIVSDAGTAKELTRITRRINLVDEQRRQIIDSYANNRITPERYVARNKALDSQLNNLNRRKSELATTVEANSGSTEKSVKRFCSNARTQYEEITDFESRRKFLQDYIEKVIFTYGRVVVVGAIPMRDKEGKKLPFKIEGEIDDKRTRIYAKKKPPVKTLSS